MASASGLARTLASSAVTSAPPSAPARALVPRLLGLARAPGTQGQTSSRLGGCRAYSDRSREIAAKLAARQGLAYPEGSANPAPGNFALRMLDLHEALSELDKDMLLHGMKPPLRYSPVTDDITPLADLLCVKGVKEEHDWMSAVLAPKGTEATEAVAVSPVTAMARVSGAFMVGVRARDGKKVMMRRRHGHAHRMRAADDGNTDTTDAKAGPSPSSSNSGH